MTRRATYAIALVLLVGVAVVAQAQETYLDSYVAQVKPEKRMEFDNLAKKIAAANRQNHGDNWIAYEQVYGEQNVVHFVSTRVGYADIDKGTFAFMTAMTKALGEAGTLKLFQDLNNCTISAHGVLRRRRPELSVNWPSDPAAQAKLVGNLRWIRMIKVYVRPGQTARFEEQLKAIKTAVESADSTTVSSVSQSTAGERGTVFYIAQLRSSLGAFDNDKPLAAMMGAGAMADLNKVVGEATTGIETLIYRIIPEFSNPPEESVAAAPDFWRPKPRPAAKPAAPAKEPAKK
jgi:quinol monooxygenase YgiN